MHETTRGVTDYPGGHNEGYPDTFKMLFRDFYRYIAIGDFTSPRPFPTFEDGHRDIVLMDAIMQSRKQGQWVEVPNGD